MTEQNKIVMRALLVAAGILTVAQVVMLVTHAADTLWLAAVLPISCIASCALLVSCVLHPEANIQYTLRKNKDKDGLKFERVTYPPDPNGLRHISAGVIALLMALLFTVIAVHLAWPETLTEGLLTKITIAILVAVIIVLNIIEGRLQRQHKNNTQSK